MSDYKAKAEARRQRILQQGANRMAIAKGEKSIETEERPLASRQSIVKSSSLNLSSSFSENNAPSFPDENNSQTNSNPRISENSSINSVDKLESKEDKITPKSPDNRPIIKNKHEESPKKDTIPEVVKASPTQSKTGILDEKTKISKEPSTSRIHIDHIMRLFRLLLLVSLGILADTTSESDGIISVPSPVSVEIEFEESNFKDVISGTPKDILYSSNKEAKTTRSWAEWSVWKIRKSLTNPLIVVNLVWWVNSLLKPVIENTVFGRPGARGVGNWLIPTIMNLFQNGITGR